MMEVVAGSETNKEAGEGKKGKLLLLEIEGGILWSVLDRELR